MNKNNTTCKCILQTSIIFLLLLCISPCFPVSAAPFETAISETYTNNDSLGIKVRSSDVGWKYKSVNGILYKRKYDYTLKKWIGKWIRVN
jgi:hypothetical protein